MRYDYDYVREHISMKDVLARYGLEVDKSGNRCCPIHPNADNTQGFGIHDQGKRWTCRTRGCGTASSNIDFVAAYEQIDHHAAFLKLKEWFGLTDDQPTPKPKTVKGETAKPKPKPVESIWHDYRNERGEVAYRMERVQLDDGGKRFMPQMPDGSRTCPKESRILYNLDKITAEPEDMVFLVEGEKTADAVCECGYVGTTFGFGCKSWLEQYLEPLTNRKVILMPDSDEGGEGWLKLVADALAGHVESLLTIHMPDDFVLAHPEYKGHDFADYFEVHGKEPATGFLVDELMDGNPIPRGVDQSSLNIATDICARVIREGKASGLKPLLDFRRVYGDGMAVEAMEGDAVMMVAPTGIGKTRLMHNLPFTFRELNFCIFDLELSINTLALRYIAMENRISFRDAVQRVRNGYDMTLPQLDHVYLPKTPKLTVEKMEAEIQRLENITGRRIHVVGIDYIAKMNRLGTATESIEAHASMFKNYCTETGRVGLFTSQCRRDSNNANPDYAMPHKEDAIHTSALEQSCQIAFCYCMKSGHRDVLQVKCDKYTHGDLPTEWAELHADNLRITPKRTNPGKAPEFFSNEANH
ncbi:DnaB-like helicase C-terminal domain-containing protein [Pontiella sulfatireligans]|uniref:Uncharacterized protein n=1 Tax=Pontiella sulfatireligans TaxID=2750658 RepID=A0A6C2ULY2_9BACT|nr:DnaB-like helicase C-terminal domain-containing protein [Pontiella sulfatireligans]VGO21128.1 hypothetical protein SCARR_03198 [Pontiella sulfatireligans]